jgi:GNAT superfamily N-acetyltransferase
VIKLRDAASEDHAAFVELFAELEVDEAPFSQDRFVAEMLPTTILAEIGGMPAGYAYFRLIGELVHLSQLVTAKATRRAGIGRALFGEVARRAKAHGCTSLMLNVKPQNEPAIALYESLGLTRRATNHALRVPWAMIDRLSDADAPLAVRPFDASEDERLERACGLTPGIFAERRAHPGRIFLAVEPGPAVAVFDVAFPGIRPLHAPDLPHALSLLRAARPHALPEHDGVNTLVEDQPALAKELLAKGAALRLEALAMGMAL